MAPDRTKVLALLDRVGGFHITDRTMRREQDAFAEYARNHEQLDPARVALYLRAVSRYFEGFEREARGHLRDVERRLESVNQLQFNLTAERGVALKRVEVTQGGNIVHLSPRRFRPPSSIMS